MAKYKFIDLFAGIGGFHLAFHNLGAECVFASEWDAHARATYEHNFKALSPKLFKSGNFAGDITKVDKSSIPDFDILTGGFPCRPLSEIERWLLYFRNVEATQYPNSLRNDLGCGRHRFFAC